MAENKKHWFKKGLQFDCAGCGHCCSGEPGGYVWVTDAEVNKIAEHLKVSTDDFGMKYLKNVEGHLSLIVYANGECIFFKDGKCRIYSTRPFQCSSFPFWPHILESRRKWDKRAETCPGMDRGSTRSFPAIIRALQKFRGHYDN